MYVCVYVFLHTSTSGIGFVRIYLEGQCSPEVDAGWLRHLEGSPWFSL